MHAYLGGRHLVHLYLGKIIKLVPHFIFIFEFGPLII